jgi:FAD binding domain
VERVDRRHPALIVRCAGVADVIDAVRFARRVGLPVAVRGGGHSFPGLSVCDDGLVIDLSLIKGVRVDLASRTVRAQAGVRLGELDRETQAFGLAVPGVRAGGVRRAYQPHAAADGGGRRRPPDPTDLALEAYQRAREPKRLVLLPGGHFEAYTGDFDRASGAARDWFLEHLGSRE